MYDSVPGYEKNVHCQGRFFENVRGSELEKSNSDKELISKLS